jgi:glycerophosphoryl diester phosphodiesterase
VAPTVNSNRMLLIWSLLSTMLMCGSCVSVLEPVQIPMVDYSPLLATNRTFSVQQQRMITGVYVVQIGNEYFGDTVAVRMNGSQLAIYTVRGVSFFALRCGMAADSAILLGMWRAVQGPETGAVSLGIGASQGGKELQREQGSGVGLELRGTYQRGANESPLHIRKVRNNLGRLRGFQILAHRGGGRNSERLGRSENSIPMIMLASALGATGIEIDVMLTKDNVPVLFHDPTFTARTVPSAYVQGSISEYTFNELRTVARLYYGERIPTLQEGLRAVIDSTPLQFVWLDIKDPRSIPQIITLQEELMTYAKGKQRDVEIVLGIPDIATAEAYMQSENKFTTPVLCELDVSTTRMVKAAYWAPRFTAGVLVDDVKMMQKEGRSCFVWTLDDPTFIGRFIEEGEYDGILTNYPTLLAALFYTKSKAQ